MAKKAVLVVDDEAPIRATLVRLLKSLNVGEIYEAANGQEAVDQAKTLPQLGLILLDLKMPVKDGLETLKEIRTFHPDVKVVILTGFPFYGEADQAVKSLGTFDFIVKPAELDYLERIVTTALGI